MHILLRTGRPAGTTPLIAVAALSLMTFAAQLSHAQSPWRIEPEIALGLEYDDNPILFADPEEKITAEGYGLEALLRMTYRTELSTFVLTPRLLFGRYDESSLDFDDRFINMNYRYQGQLTQFRFRGQFNDQSIRTGERFDVDFDVEDPEDIPDDDSARVFRTENRQRLRLQPEIRRRIGTRSDIGLQLTYLDLSFPNDVDDILQDYTALRIQGVYQYDVSPRTGIEVRAYHRSADFEGGRDVPGNGATLGLIRNLSETTRFVLRAGVDSTENEEGSDEANPIGELSLIRNFETWNLIASYRRSISGGGGGRISVRDSYDVTFSRDLSEKVTIGAGVGGYSTDSLESEDIFFDARDYFQLRGLFAWRITRAVSLEFDYRYTDIDRTSFERAADSNRFMARIRYAPKRQ